jgi:aminopeptidase N
LWNEFKYGRDYADYYGFEDMVAYLPGGKTIKKDLIRFDYADREQMFDEVTYQKGGRILHMLRKTVGDEAFFKALNLYLTSNAYKTAEVHDLRLAFEEVTGQDLNWFFSQWFLASGHPVLNIQTGYNAINGTITVNIKQSQDRSNTPLYKLPIAIDLYTNGSVRREEIILDMADQSFQFTSSTEPLLINVDAEKYLLAEKTENKSVLQYAYQYEIAPLFMDRYEAIKALQALKAEEPARITIIRSLKDKNWAIRKMAVDFIPQLTEEEKRSLYDTVKDMALNDPRSYVRAAAIIQLKKTYAARSNREIYNLASKDKAISVIEALNAND